MYLINNHVDIMKDLINKIVTKSVDVFNNHKSFTRNYTFENRSKNSNTLCIILAGYKEFTWDIVFERIRQFSDEKIDVCIVSSGLYSEKLSEITKKNDWSYVSTKKNSVCLAQNMVIKLFPYAKYIYKIDEDIFVTKNFFKTLKDTYDEVQENSEYDVGFVAPIIPVNGFAHIRLLNRLDLIDYYNEKFEKVKYSASNDRMIVNNTNVAKFMWGENGMVPHIDDLGELLNNDDFKYSICNIRFSIGAIYFTRDLWNEMKYFNVALLSVGMGFDEIQICSHCITHSKAIVVSENTCVGHLSFGLQNNEMELYFKENPSRFVIKE